MNTIIGHDLRSYLEPILDWDEVSIPERALMLLDQTGLWNKLIIRSGIHKAHHEAFCFVADAIAVHYAELRNFNDPTVMQVAGRVKGTATARGFAYLLWLKLQMEKHFEQDDSKSLLFDVNDIDVALDTMSHVISSGLKFIDMGAWNISFNQMLSQLHHLDVSHAQEALNYLEVENV